MEDEHSATNQIEIDIWMCSVYLSERELPKVQKIFMNAISQSVILIFRYEKERRIPIRAHPFYLYIEKEQPNKRLMLFAARMHTKYQNETATTATKPTTSSLNRCWIGASSIQSHQDKMNEASLLNSLWNVTEHSFTQPFAPIHLILVYAFISWFNSKLFSDLNIRERLQ